MKDLYKIYFMILILGLNACGSDESNGGASRIVIGPSKVLLVPNPTQYQQGFVVQITDTEGNPAPSARVTLKMVPIQYFKGQYIGVDTGTDGDPDAWGVNRSAACTAEDANNDGVLDAGEDINSNGTLEPTNPATLALHPDLEPTFVGGAETIITDESGFGYFSVTYPVGQALWTKMRMTASASVSGTESNENYEFTLFVSQSDISGYPEIAPPGGTLSPYGTSANCTDAL